MNPRLELLPDIIKFEIVNRYLIEGKMILGLCSSSKFLSSFKIISSSSITLNPRLSGLQVSRGENVKRNVFNGNCNSPPKKGEFSFAFT